SVVHWPGRASPHPGVGHHGGRGGHIHRLRRVVAGPVSRYGVDAGRVLFQPLGRRSTRPHRPAETHMSEARVPLLVIEDLAVEFRTRTGTVYALDQVHLQVTRGETVGIVGESGSGKSVLAYAVMGILDPAGRITRGQIIFGGLDVVTAAEDALEE